MHRHNKTDIWCIRNIEMGSPQELVRKICVALDIPCLRDALQLAETLQGVCGYFKVGLELYSSAGPAAVESLVSAGHRVILDLKLYDIPNTVGRAVRQVSSLGASFLTIHASGGQDMIRTAREAAESVKAPSSERVKLLAVTVLTSTTESSLRKTFGARKSLKETVLDLALLSKDSGADGVVASAGEVHSIKRACGENFLVATPGIRPEGEKKGDQKRTATPSQALSAGSDILIIGRPITQAANPRTAALNILKEIESAKKRRR
jgi:orotidine-5'-phosphate decarboxylase